ncbi:FecCD family ABC transporter permease [Reinekea blandensis]|uniref:Putative permease of ferrichrome ABC transporter n=1 Tax=Reinekea blandensis MED297 TaxID=314283 RepID=A4BJ33_9GAMM|nr:iron ABC transporter permease [Reinekea blandensis]EAR07878.1 putative permease of ferrichrome ABC transporter [Reinekea sp. MED297] [Reinekea blandensis MED297]
MTVVRLFQDQISFRLQPSGLLALGMAVALVLLTLVISLLSGSFELSPQDVWQALQNPLADAQHRLVVWEFRLPRTLVAVFSGALFALSGAMLQNLTRNALADPSLIGISQGAALAVVALIVVFPEFGNEWREVAAFSGSLGVAALIRLVSGEGHSLKFILMGIGVAAFITALTSAMLTYGDIEEAMSALAWLAGSVNSANWSDVRILAIACSVLIVLYLLQSRALSPMALGHETATGLGVPLRRVGRVQLLSAVMAAALATAVVGPLGFVGLLAPHLTRQILRTGPATFLLLTALVGGLLVMIADLAGRVLFDPIQLPAGLVTSLIGAPVFIWLMLRPRPSL